MSSYVTNTLSYDSSLCTGCGLCSIVCPHRVFEQEGRAAKLARPENCMECGACQRNCAARAIEVRSGVGCASALLLTALLGREEATCGCCGGDSGGGGREAAACCAPLDETHGEDRRS